MVEEISFPSVSFSPVSLFVSSVLTNFSDLDAISSRSALFADDVIVSEREEKRGWEVKRRRTKYYDTFWLKPTAGYNFISYPKFFSTVRIPNVLNSYMYFWAHNSSIHRSIYKEFLPMWLTKICLTRRKHKRCLYCRHCTYIFSCHAHNKTTLTWFFGDRKHFNDVIIFAEI